MSDLLFRAPGDGRADLLFGGRDDASVPCAEATLDDRFEALAFAAAMIPDARIEAAFDLGELTFEASAQYLSRAARPVVGRMVSTWHGAKGSVTGATSGFSATAALPAGFESDWQAAARAARRMVGAHADAQRTRCVQRASRFSDAVRLCVPACVSACRDARHGQRMERRSDYANASRLPAMPCIARHQDADHRPRRTVVSGFGQATGIRVGRLAAFGVGQALRVVVRSRAQQAIRPPAGKHVKPLDPTGPETPAHWPTADLLFYRLWDGSAALLFGDAPEPSGGFTRVVPIRRIYFVKNTQSLFRVPDGKEIAGADLRLSIDVDSWSWGWSASVPGRHLTDLRGDADAQVELEARINGHAFRLVVEKVARDRRFARSTLAVSGRGRAAWLADPYAPVHSHANAQARLAQQLMADALTENGVSLGWDLDWQITDWLVPAGAWSHAGTPMDACLAIAEAAGAYLQAHPASPILHVLPRYPAAPWHWAELTPDIALPEDVCVTEGIVWEDKPAYNTVFVAGQEGGVLAHVTRAGTDGGTPAPMVTDPLITHADAGRQRGLSILSNTGRQALISLSLPVLEETGIILPGKLVQYSENGNIHLGLTRAVDVSASFPKVRQTIRLETHVL